MKVFMTGATGTIGHAVMRELIASGHEVTALLRSPQKRPALEAAGARVHPGDLASPDSYRDAARDHDVLVHAAMDYGGDTVEADRAAVDTMLAALAPGHRARRFLYTSGCWILGDTGDDDAAEDASTADPAPLVRWRTAHEESTLRGAEDPEATTVVLRPGLVYGGPGSLTAAWYRGAVDDGAAPLVGLGENHWSLIELGDLARLYRALVESDASGVFHGVDNHPIRAREAVEAASRAAGAEGRVRRVPVAEARRRMGPVADALVLEQRIVTRRAAEVGWEPRTQSYLEGAAAAFEEWRKAEGR